MENVFLVYTKLVKTISSFSDITLLLYLVGYPIALNRYGFEVKAQRE